MVVNVSDFRKNLFAYLRKVSLTNDKIFVTTKNGNICIINENYLNSLEETCYLLSNSEAYQTIEKGLKENRENLLSVDWKEALR